MPTPTKHQYSTHSCQKVSESSCRTAPSKRCFKGRKLKKKTRKGLISWKNKNERKRKKRLLSEQSCSRKKKPSGSRQKERKISTISPLELLPSLFHLLFKRTKMNQWIRHLKKFSIKLKKFMLNHNNRSKSRRIFKNWEAHSPICLNNPRELLTAQNQLLTTIK